ncbi:MAG: ferrous iron transport protein B [Bacilli bacterium]|nr:ferrous iron transport protein B [Bacilli bacterium]
MKIALVGNQNSGKTTLFNLLTGSNQKIGNWPGVTIECKTGIIRGTDHELVDLPGIYSLSPYTLEEEVSRKFIFEENPDIIINIIDATSIERSLYLTTQLLELDTKIIIALNMTDILEKKGMHIEVEKLREELDAEIVLISALKKTGIQELIDRIENRNIRLNQNQPIFHSSIEKAITQIEQTLQGAHHRFIAIKLLEEDPLFASLHAPFMNDMAREITSLFGTDLEELIASGRYQYITALKKRTISHHPPTITMTDRLDRIFLHRWLALPIFFVIMFLVYYLAVGTVGHLTIDFIDSNISNFSAWVHEQLLALKASQWSASLISDGIIAGVGAVLNFVPQLMILFLCISILETTGYMSRIAFFLDRIFKHFGLSGKSLIPFIVGSGCSVPGIMATRTVEDQEERRMSIILTPFIPCSAKLPIIVLFAGYFFPNHAGLVSASMYFLAIFVILISAVIMKKFFFKGKPSAFISELPEYKTPNLRHVLRDVRDKTFEFIIKAGTIILVSSIIIWVLLSFSWRFQYGVDVEDSILASIGRFFSWVFYPILGELSWGATVSAIQGLVAKEQVVSSMSIIAGLSEDVSSSSLIFNSQIFSFFTPLNAYSFMVFNLFSAPCFGAIGAMRRELGSNKRTWLALLFQTGIAWILASLIFGIGILIGGVFL